MFLYVSFPTWLKPEIIPGLPFRWYGAMYIVVIFITYLLFKTQVKEEKINMTDDDIYSLFLYTIIGALLGGRLIYTLIFEASGMFRRQPWLIFWPFNEKMKFIGFSGMNYYGGLLGAIIGFVLYTRSKKLNVSQFGDMIAAAFPLGYSFGRLGNFINGELYGRITTAPWGMIFPHAKQFSAKLPWVQEIAAKINFPLPDPEAMVNLPRHPSQIYELFLEGVLLWLFLWFFIRKRKKLHGSIMAWYLIGYGIVRFFVDYLRMPIGKDFAIRLVSIDNPPSLLLTPWNFLLSQIFCIPMILGGVLFLYYLKKNHSKEQEIEEMEKKKKVKRKRELREQRKNKK